ncbi:MAG: FAD binding domain-containing protein [Alphaproteobacteria bacterium]|nr:FAD binding domain-containing protein [Alphaproteobacteria bacterium]MBV9863447.1 FAD binding domain-containing protein [Alphaproteobacteria bacterium]
MIPFELVEPGTLDEALALLDPEDSGVRAIAGGTALMLMLKSGLFRPTRLVSLRRIGDGLETIEAQPDGGLRIGAMVPLRQLERAAAVRRGLPVIAETLRSHSNIRVRNVATLGGNLAHADPHMDLPPVLIALDAAAEIAGPRGRRLVAVADLFAGYYETVLAGDELIAAVHVPAPRGPAAYVKMTARSADDWPALGIAVAVTREDDSGGGRSVRDARVVISAATEKAMRLPATEALLRGRNLDETLARQAGREAAAEAPVVGDLRGSAAYKRVLVDVALRRALGRVLES